MRTVKRPVIEIAEKYDLTTEEVRNIAKSSEDEGFSRFGHHGYSGGQGYGYGYGSYGHGKSKSVQGPIVSIVNYSSSIVNVDPNCGDEIKSLKGKLVLCPGSRVTLHGHCDTWYQIA